MPKVFLSSTKIVVVAIQHTYTVRGIPSITFRVVIVTLPGLCISCQKVSFRNTVIMLRLKQYSFSTQDRKQPSH